MKLKYKSSWRKNSKLSKSEIKVFNTLKALNVPFIREVEFSLLKNHSFDFYLPQENIIIEFDGEQHYSSKNIFDKGNEATFKYRQYRDTLKNNFCNEYKIKLIRLRNKNIKNLELLLAKAIVPSKEEVSLDKNLLQEVKLSNRDKKLLASAKKELLKSKPTVSTVIDNKTYYRKLKPLVSN